MFGLFTITGFVVVLVALTAWFEPNEDRARLAQARRTLRRSGRHYPKGSKEEEQALRVVLEGDSLQQV